MLRYFTLFAALVFLLLGPDEPGSRLAFRPAPGAASTVVAVAS